MALKELLQRQKLISVMMKLSHGARGKTKRNEAMFLTAGHIYVYLIYGMYYCLNIVTEAKGYPSAVLIRGLYLEKEKIHLDGPGKLCRHLNIDLSLNKERLNQSMFIKGNSFLPKFDTTVRIGISKAKDKLLRFVMTKPSLNDYLCNKL